MPIRRKLLRISLRTFLVLVTILCLWFGKISFEAHRQKAAVEWLLKNGGAFGYDWKNHPYLADETASGLQWLRHFLGDDYFLTVQSCTVAFTDDISRLADLPDIEDLSIDGIQAPDISFLGKLTKLQSLSARGCGIRDISVLSKLVHLKYVWLNGNGISDCTPRLRLHDLEIIELQDNPVTSDMIEKLRQKFPKAQISWTKPTA
jgi:hypothetical protein